MDTITLTIDDVEVKARPAMTVLQAAQDAGIYIPTLCAHPDLPPAIGIKVADLVYRGQESIENAAQDKEFAGCQLCLVEIEGAAGPVTSCNTPASPAMVVHTNAPQIQAMRRDNLVPILARHPHACITCDQREGCSPFEDVCHRNVSVNERCCPLLGYCELQKVVDYIGISEYAPRYAFKGLPTVRDGPLFDLDYNMCIDCTRCVRVCRDVRGIEALGCVYQGSQLVVGVLGSSLKESGCKFCGACVEVCPTGALMDKGVKWAERETALVPCTNACPAGIDVPRYVRLVADGKYAEAAAVSREKVPFPEVLGRVCFRPCQARCRRGALNEPIAIKYLKRFAAERDTGLWKQRAKQAAATGKRVAVVGSGPAGLTCAHYLAKLGHSVVVLEMLPEPGGMMRAGIPQYRLPRHVLDSEIEVIKGVGVDIRTNARVESLDRLLDEGYDAVFLALGAGRADKLGVPGEDNPGVKQAISWLREANRGQEVKPGSRVAVIGGGNAALDAARVALRLGAKQVTIIYRRSRAEMPADTGEIEEAIEEAVDFLFLAAPKGIASQNGVVKLECLRMRLGKPDASGRPRPEPISGSEFSLDFDTVIAAIGQRPEVPGRFGLARGPGDTIQVNPDTLATDRKGVFAGGDAVSGPASVIEAIAAGRKATISIDKYLGGEGVIDEALVEADVPEAWLGHDEDFAYRGCLAMPCLPRDKRLGDFAEVELGYDEKAAVDEARRCLKCDLRFQLSALMLPPEDWLEFTPDKIAALPQAEGVFQLLDAEETILYILGTRNLRQNLRELLDADEPAISAARYFKYEETYMYTMRESELLQQFIERYGKMPQGNSEII
jgi:NADPH-dependent glutamate synthase beta subunit-like oxidoreductase/Pyruvate/2-oxoacid:ferredoxin oxidoreductase delta subunit